ncbi:acyl carrier protein [Bartonella rattaustraliani]|uniref:acyl carrier protein n=1 Tax=Bartonella rattaustraliani TaxID=481139 RepID=UPI000380FD4A|nr:acyl carrier protein [Bartonella rattaustraliani]
MDKIGKYYRSIILVETHTADDLGDDSLDFFDIVFTLDKDFKIKVPLKKWTQEVNEESVATEEYFVLKSFCAKIDELIALKQRRWFFKQYTIKLY